MMDELLFERVEQLKEIDDRLERILGTSNGLWDWDSTRLAITNLRNELAVMIEKVKAEHTAF